MISDQIFIVLCLFLGALAQTDPGLYCPDPEYTALVVRINFLEIEIRTVKDLVASIEGIEEFTDLINALEALESLPDDFASLQEDVDEALAALGIRIDDLEANYDARLSGLDTSVADLNTALSGVQAALEARLDALEANLSGYKAEVDARFTALDDELSADIDTVDTESKARDAELQENLDTVEENCEAKLADLEAQIATALSDISGLEATTAILTSGQARIDGEVDAVESGLSTTNAEIVQLASGALFTFLEWSEWTDCSTTCDLGLQTRTRECPGDECASSDGLGRTDSQVCDSGVLCPIIDSGKVLIIGGIQEGDAAIPVQSEILDVRSGERCSAPQFETDYRDGIFGTILYNRFPVIAGGDSIKEVIHVFKQDGTVEDIKVQGDGSSRKYAGAITLADKEHMMIVGGYYASEGTFSKSAEIIHLNAEGTEATGEHGPDIPKALAYPCFTDFKDADGNRKFFLFGGSTSVSTTADDQRSAFSTSGWVLAESDFDADDDTSWDNAVSTPDFTDFAMAFITCKAFKNSEGKEEIMIVGSNTGSNTLIYNPESNAFRAGPSIKLEDDDLTMLTFMQSSLYASTEVENEVILTGGYLFYHNDAFTILQTKTYSKYTFKMTCPDGETDAANCPFEVQDIELKRGRHSHVSFHVPNAFTSC